MYVHALNVSPRCFLLIGLISSSHSQLFTQSDKRRLTFIPLGGTVLFYFQWCKSYLLFVFNSLREFKMDSINYLFDGSNNKINSSASS